MSSTIPAHNPVLSFGLVEDQAFFRDLIRDLIERHFHWRVDFAAATADEALAACQRKWPDLLLLDLHIPGGRDGIDLALQLLAAKPDLRILALSSQIDDFTLHRVVTSGIRGFVDKNSEGPEVLREAILKVAGGKVYFAEAVRRVKIRLASEPFSFKKVLSDREQQLLVFFGAGLSDEEVGAKFGLSKATTHTHRRNILRKLDLHNTPDLMRFSLLKGFVKLPTAELLQPSIHGPGQHRP